MDNLFIVLLILIIIGCLGKSGRSSHGGCIVKPKIDTKRPKVAPAPQPLKR